jgi:hypothetical protein
MNLLSDDRPLPTEKARHLRLSQPDSLLLIGALYEE